MYMYQISYKKPETILVKLNNTPKKIVRFRKIQTDRNETDTNDFSTTDKFLHTYPPMKM